MIRAFAMYVIEHEYHRIRKDAPVGQRVLTDGLGFVKPIAPSLSPAGHLITLTADHFKPSGPFADIWIQMSARMYNNTDSFLRDMHVRPSSP